MLSKPAGVHEPDLTALLAQEWGITAPSLEHRPVGFGSHHWQAGHDWFVTVDELPAADNKAADKKGADKKGADEQSAGKGAAADKKAADKQSAAKGAAAEEADGKEADGKEADGKEADGKGADGKEADGKEAAGQMGADNGAANEESADNEAAGKEAADNLAAALGTAQDLRAGGLSFVVAPIPTRSGAPLARLGTRYAVAVYPYVEGQSFDWGDWSSPEHHRAVLDLVVALHTTTIPTRARADDLGIPHRAALTADRADGHDHGPYSRRAAHLLAGHRTAIRRRLAEYDALVPTQPSTVVITHGEPHPGNTMLTTQGWRLIDWDTVRLAPPERDLWSLGSNEGHPDDYYTAATGYRPDPRLLELFRLRWDLSDLAVTAERFRRPHTGDADDDESWEILESLVSAL